MLAQVGRSVGGVFIGRRYVRYPRNMTHLQIASELLWGVWTDVYGIAAFSLDMLGDLGNVRRASPLSGGPRTFTRLKVHKR